MTTASLTKTQQFADRIWRTWGPSLHEDWKNAPADRRAEGVLLRALQQLRGNALPHLTPAPRCTPPPAPGLPPCMVRLRNKREKRNSDGLRRATGRPGPHRHLDH